MHRYHTVGYTAMVDSGKRAFTEARVRAILNCIGRGMVREHWLLVMKLLAEVMFVHAVRLHQSAILRDLKKKQAQEADEADEADQVEYVQVVSARDALNAKFQAAEKNGNVIDLTQRP